MQPKQKILVIIIAIFLSITAYANSNSLWHVIRDGYQLNHHVNNKTVQDFIHYYQQRPQLIHDVIQQSKPFLYLVVKQVNRRHLPTELALVPVIESAFHNTAYSAVGAAGAWQLMPGTAENYQITITPRYDGREDITKSTAAALSYLKYLHNYFDSNWLLAIAAYNAGLGTIKQAIHHNLIRNLPTDFWALNLPEQTRLYVPKILAFATIIQNPNYYGIDLPSIPNEPIVAPVFLPSQMSLIKAAQYAGISLSNLQRLNPAYRLLVTPPHGRFYLTLPINHIVEFERHLAEHLNDPIVQWHEYRVHPGDTLNKIALKTHTNPRILVRYNKLDSTQVDIGQTLVYPSHITTTPKQNIIHIVQPGDTLSAIATHFDVTLMQILRWNHLNQHSILHVDQHIIIR